MKRLFEVVTSMLVLSLAISQNLVLNPGFENESLPSLENWEVNCFAESVQDAPAGEGDWSLRLESGNYQGCFPGLATQLLPDLAYGPNWVPVVSLGGWIKLEEGISLASGIGIGDPVSGDMLMSAFSDASEWVYVEAVDTLLNLSPGTDYHVILDAGAIGGPGIGHTRFDGISVIITQFFQKGDVNADGNTDILDIVAIVSIILGFQEMLSPYELWAGDVNGDDDINILDIVLLMAAPFRE